MMRIAVAQLNPIVGDIDGNLKKALDAIEKAKIQKADIILFPEMMLLGYPPEDLVLLDELIEALERALEHVVHASIGISVIIGTVRRNPFNGEKHLFNSAAIIENGNLLGFQDKTLLPDYDVFSERRYFEPSAWMETWVLAGKKVGITICEDLWQHADAVEYSSYLRDPVNELKAHAVDIVLNLSASPFYLGRNQIRLKVCAKAAQTLNCPVILCNQVGGNDSIIFDGTSLFVDRLGMLKKAGKAFVEDLFIISPFETSSTLLLPPTQTEELFQALVLGIRDYFSKQGFQKACLGLSGGIDSALVTCLAVEALGKENVTPIFMPSRFTSQASKDDSEVLVKNLNIGLLEISIENCFETMLETLHPYFQQTSFDTTEENIQSRLRGMILMAFSNKFGALVLGTGNKSELAMGYSTLYGDMCGGLAVVGDVTKDQVYALAQWINRQKEVIPHSIIEKPPSAELRLNQKDTDSLPPYSVVDAVLVDYIENNRSANEIATKHQFPLDIVKSLIRRIHLNEYKRKQSPPVLRVTKKAFTVGRRFPIVQGWNV